VNVAYCLEGSIDGKFVLIGGGNNEEEHRAKIAVMSFDKEMQIIGEYEIGESRSNSIYCIRRHKHQNIFFAGCNGCIIILYLSESGQLSPIKELPFTKKCEVTDVRFYGKALYAISPAIQQIQVINFNTYDEYFFLKKKESAPLKVTTLFDAFRLREMPLKGNI